MALPKVRIGDVFEIQTSKGFGYFQCVNETPKNESETIRVFSGNYKNISEVGLKNFVNMKEEFFIQFPVKFAVKKKCIKYVGNCKIPEFFELPRYYRSKHKIGEDFICWHIVDSVNLQRRSVENLTDEDKKLSPWGSWNDTLLAERIAEGWTLEDWK